MKTLQHITLVLVTMSGLSACSTDSDSDLKIIGGAQAPNTENVKSSFPSTVGILLGRANKSCTATRIDQNLYLTAAHCVDTARNQDELTIKPSNAQNFDGQITNIRIVPGYAGVSTTNSDLATFSVLFKATEQKFVFDSLVEIAKINYSQPEVGQAVSLAGFGCEEARDISGITEKCLKGTGFLYMKTAKSNIASQTAGFVLTGSQLFFRLPVPVTFSAGVDGYIGGGWDDCDAEFLQRHLGQRALN